MLLDQGHVFFTFTSVEEEMLQAVGTATNKSIPLRGNSCAVSKPHKKRQIEIAHVELFQSHRWQAFSAVWNARASFLRGLNESMTQGVSLCVITLST